MNFTEKDIQQIEKKGLTIKKVEKQIELFKTGLPPINLKAAATVDDDINGIKKLSDEKKQHFINHYDTKRDAISIVKFVPASGAATRMFKTLFGFADDYNPDEETINSFINKNKDLDLSLFFVGLEKLPFYELVLKEIEKHYPEYSAMTIDKQRYIFVKTMLDQDKLNYGFYPKGLLPFHKYKSHIATAFEEHLFESSFYASSNGEAKLHFTISEKYQDIFDDEFKRIEDIVERKTKTRFDISFSFQKESTDTIAVTPKDEPFRDDDGRLVFRPSGHGALLENLNDLDADIIFIKNIDNVVVFNYEQDVATYKKVLGGMLLELREQTFNHLRSLDEANIADAKILEIAEFLVQRLNVKVSHEFEKYSKKYQIEYLQEKLNRPIRVCGMVKNEGEPGGGPFWIKEESGNISLQIVESAQVDRKSKNQKEILKNSTHFNPVDLVCSVRNYKGEKFNLEKYSDPKTSFITMKTKVGKDLKALELPGLWNGSMANWNSIFVEVPLITFNPVKTVTDLLKTTHQIKR